MADHYPVVSVILIGAGSLVLVCATAVLIVHWLRHTEHPRQVIVDKCKNVLPKLPFLLSFMGIGYMMMGAFSLASCLFLHFKPKDADYFERMGSGLLCVGAAMLAAGMASRLWRNGNSPA